MEIPKSFIFPFAITWGVYFFCVLLQAVSVRIMPKILNFLKRKSVRASLQKKWVTVLVDFDLWIFVSPLILVVLYRLLGDSVCFWITSSLLIGQLLLIKSFSSKTVASIFHKSQLSFFILTFGINTPLISFALGKVNGINVYNNKDIRCVKNIIVNTSSPIKDSKDSVSFKLLGFLGDKFIVSSLDNKKIFVLNQSAFDNIELENKK
jgi:putative Mn2+ efflux pump MntP